MRIYIELLRNQFIKYMEEQGYPQEDIIELFSLDIKEVKKILEQTKNCNIVNTNSFNLLKKRYKEIRKKHQNLYKDRLLSTKTSYEGMKSRCNDPKRIEYKHYGGRGIVICDRWQGKEGFKNFLSDMGVKPDVSLSIDRINNDGNYEPKNCQWATVKEQANNRKRKM